MFYQRHALRFACTGCGECCTGGRDRYVAVQPQEQRRICDFLGLSWDWFRRRYIVRVDARTEGLRLERGRCVFLDGEHRCKIYRVRPVQCRTYPFWPELIATKTAWRNETRRCEGIDQGAVTPIAKIKRLLKKQRRS